MASFVVNLAEVSDRDLALVGGKAGKLGELVRHGLPIPPGFVVTTEAFQGFVDATPLSTDLPAALAQLDLNRPESVDAVSRRIRDGFEGTEFPASLRATLTEAYERFVREEDARFSAVRSSATAEDLEGASFAGLQETYLNVHGTEAVLMAIRRCWGSLFTPRVLVYRARKGFDHSTVKLAVLVQKMVESKVSGILFTRDPNTGENHMIIEAGFGLGEPIVGGEVTPDHYVVDGATQKIIHKQVADQSFQVVRSDEGGNVKQELSAEMRTQQKMPDDQIHRLASLGRVIESYYRRPMDIEWCADGGGLYIVQARPVTTLPSGGAPGAPPPPSRESSTGPGTPPTAPSAPAAPSSGEEPLLKGLGASP
ncbi:MAG TPA: PEP/pyruvate-binding domain-containing protein, partial [Thermoplasmata archaeon]|nr:PEP/pyruvate-binding domain-containing protein [Thermoplasmata archaeon]